jgi:hypothetical protein
LDSGSSALALVALDHPRRRTLPPPDLAPDLARLAPPRALALRVTFGLDLALKALLLAGVLAFAFAAILGLDAVLVGRFICLTAGRLAAVFTGRFFAAAALGLALTLAFAAGAFA